MPRPVSHDPSGPRRAVAGLAAWSLLTAGCSFMFSEGPPARHQTLENYTCGESYVPPVLDSVAGGLLVLSVAGAASSKDAEVAKEAPINRDDRRREINTSIGVSAAFAAIAVGSAVYGYLSVGSCHDARAERDIALARARVLPPPYGVPPAGGPPPIWPPPPGGFWPQAPVPWPPPTGRTSLPPQPPPAPPPPPAVPPEDVPPTPVTPLPAPAPSP